MKRKQKNISEYSYVKEILNLIFYLVFDFPYNYEFKVNHCLNENLVRFDSPITNQISLCCRGVFFAFGVGRNVLKTRRLLANYALSRVLLIWYFIDDFILFSTLCFRYPFSKLHASKKSAVPKTVGVKYFKLLAD